ncbi:MAG: hypothetical protein V4726_21600 [Verrucomicrobiota bacterium]
MANSNDFPGTPQDKNPDDSGVAPDPFESAPAPDGGRGGGQEEEWPIDAPLPADFERQAERREPVTPKPVVRISPIAPSGGTSFESNPRSGFSAPSAPQPAAPTPAPAPVSRSGTPSGHRAGTPRPDDDPFQTDEPLPAVSRPAPADRIPGPEKKSPVNDGENEAESGAPEEFEAPEPPDAPSSEVSTGHRTATKAEKLSMAAVLVVVLGLLGIFANALHAGRPLSSDSEADAIPRVPMKGSVATITKIETDWRPRREADRVSMMDTALPEVSRSQPEVLPEVKFSIDPGASKTGFLRFIFLDPEGQISGDVLVVKVTQGKLENSGGGTEVSSPTDGAVYCSLGFLDRPSFISYAIGDSRRWTVEVSESTDYNARQDGWARLGLFEVRPQQ